MSKIVTLKEGDTEIYPVTSTEAIFDKVKTGNIQDSTINVFYEAADGTGAWGGRILLWGIKGEDMGI